MAKFEYKVFYYEPCSKKWTVKQICDDLQFALNTFGLSGWELSGVKQNTYYFKRPLSF